MPEKAFPAYRKKVLKIQNKQNTDETYCYIRIKHGKAKMTTRIKDEEG